MFQSPNVVESIWLCYTEELVTYYLFDKLQSGVPAGRFIKWVFMSNMKSLSLAIQTL